MSLEQLMALAARLERQPRKPAWPPLAATQPSPTAARSRSYSLSAQEWDQLFPEHTLTPSLSSARRSGLN